MVFSEDLVCLDGFLLLANELLVVCAALLHHVVPALAVLLKGLVDVAPPGAALIRHYRLLLQLVDKVQLIRFG